MSTRRVTTLLAVLAASAVAAAVGATGAAAAANQPDDQITTDAAGHVVAVTPSTPWMAPASTASDPHAIATANLIRLAGEFHAAGNMQVTDARAVGRGHTVRSQQRIDDVPVYGGQIVQRLDAGGRLVSALGKTASATAGRFPQADAQAPTRAASAARDAFAQEWHTTAADVTVRSVAPYWYDRTLGGAAGKPVAVPAYQVRVAGEGQRGRAAAMVDANSARVLDHWSETHHAVNRAICDADRTVVNSTGAAIRCGTQFRITRGEGDPKSSVTDVNHVYKYFGDAQTFYAKHVDVDLTDLIGANYGDGAGKALRGTVRLCLPQQCPYRNAFWNGEQMAFGEGVTTEDVTGHELTHGVTQHTSGLGGGQAASINEGLSDVFGKFIGIAAGDPNDTGANRWLIGAGSALGAIRNMADPPSSSSVAQPAKVNGPLWQTGNPDPHVNDGVINKADYLITDGDTFNGQTVTGLGTEKATAVWWGVENLLTPQATFPDVGNALNSACQADAADGTAGITTTDCEQVSKAVKATQLDQQPR